jgi:hypothetical protein
MGLCASKTTHRVAPRPGAEHDLDDNRFILLPVQLLTDPKKLVEMPFDSGECLRLAQPPPSCCQGVRRSHPATTAGAGSVGEQARRQADRKGEWAPR